MNTETETQFAAKTSKQVCIKIEEDPIVKIQ